MILIIYMALILFHQIRNLILHDFIIKMSALISISSLDTHLFLCKKVHFWVLSKTDTEPHYGFLSQKVFLYITTLCSELFQKNYSCKCWLSTSLIKWKIKKLFIYNSASINQNTLRWANFVLYKCITQKLFYFYISNFYCQPQPKFCWCDFSFTLLCGWKFQQYQNYAKLIKEKLSD